MYTIISGTNRPKSNSLFISHLYKEILGTKGIEAQILSLEDLPENLISSALYENTGKNELFNNLLESIKSSQKYIFVIPEYNGSFPGVLKTFIDGFTYPSFLNNKKAALIGISSGMSGGTIALSHFTDILNYLGVNVIARKIKIPNIDNQLRKGDLEALYHQLLKTQSQELIDF